MATVTKSHTKGTPPYGFDNMSDEAIATDVRKAYASVSSDPQKSVFAQIQKMAKLWLRYAKGEPGPKKAYNALKQLAAVPLTSSNVTWAAENDLRLAFYASLDEAAQAGSDELAKYLDDAGAQADYRQDQDVRAAFRNAIRIDADPSDVARVMQVVRSEAD